MTSSTKDLLNKSLPVLKVEKTKDKKKINSLMHKDRTEDTSQKLGIFETLYLSPHPKKNLILMLVLCPPSVQNHRTKKTD